MIASLSGHTIISECLDITAGAPSRSALREGFIFAGEHGINEALFKPRALKISGNRDNAYIYGFFMGAVLCDEIKSINALSEKRVVIGGRREIKEAMAYLLSEFSDKEITVLDEDTVAYSTVKGAVRIFERKREMQ